MAHLEKRITSDGRTTYRAKVSVAGFPAKSATFDKRADARDWATSLESDMRAGRYGFDVLARKHTGADLIERYIKTTLKSKTKNKATIAKQRAQLEWWAERLKDCLLINLTPFIINDCKDELAGDNYSLRSPATVNSYLDALNHVINTAIREWGWMSTNPLAKITKPKEPKGRARFLTESECAALLAACKREKRKTLYLIVLFALSTGARKGEILGLKRKDVDIIRRVVVAYDTKNGDNRQLYLTDALAMQLAEHLTRGSKSRLVFASRSGGQLNIETAWRRALKHAGINDFRFHDLRHTAASYMAMNGANPADIGEALGHKSLSMVKRYSHLSTTHVGNVVRAMGEKMFGQQLQQQGASA